MLMLVPVSISTWNIHVQAPGSFSILVYLLPFLTCAFRLNEDLLRRIVEHSDTETLLSWRLTSHTLSTYLLTLSPLLPSLLSSLPTIAPIVCIYYAYTYCWRPLPYSTSVAFTHVQVLTLEVDGVGADTCFVVLACGIAVF